MPRQSLLIIGAGGHGRVVADAAALLDPGLEIGFLDDAGQGKVGASRHRVLGPVSAMASMAQDWKSAVVAIGDAKVRLELTARLRDSGFALRTIVHPRATVSPTAVIGEGVSILANAVINTGARIGDACIVNSGAIVEHDCILEDGVHVCPGCVGGGRAGRGSQLDRHRPYPR